VHGLGSPLLGEAGIIIVRIDVFALITFRVSGAHQDVIARLRSRIAGDVAVGDDHPFLRKLRI